MKPIEFFITEAKFDGKKNSINKYPFSSIKSDNIVNLPFSYYLYHKPKL